MKEENGLGKGLIIGFITGSIVGSVVALLFAPKSGKELRTDIREKSEEWWKETEDIIDRAKDKASDIINEGKKKSENLVAEAKVKVDALIKEAEEIIDGAKSKTGEILNDGIDTINKKGERLKSAIKAGIETYKNEKGEQA
jgi:gas vesicle protein